MHIYILYIWKCQSDSNLAVKQDLWQWRHHLFKHYLSPLFWIWLSNYLTKKCHPEKNGIWGWNPVDSHLFCTQRRAPSHGQMCYCNQFRNQKSPECQFSTYYVLWYSFDFILAKLLKSTARAISYIFVLLFLSFIISTYFSYF